MKQMRRFMSVLLAVVMIAAMVLPVGAADDGKITISNAVVGQTYSIYRIFELESYDANKNAYSYKTNTKWTAFVNSMASYVTIDSQGYVTWIKGTDEASRKTAAAEFAAAAIAYAKANSIAPDRAAAASVTPVSFTDLPLGYYLVDSTLGVLCSLTTTDKEAVVTEKNEAPTVTKEVEEDSTGLWGEVNDANIGQTINFRTTIKVQKGAVNYVLHDKMEAGLTFDANSIKVYLGSVADSNLVNTNHYTKLPTILDGCTFELSFANSFVSALPDDTDLIVTYSAALNQNAVVGSAGNLNETWLKYGDNNTTEHDYTRTHTWEIPVFKYYLNTTTGAQTALAGAGFTLYTDSACTNPVTFSPALDLSNLAITDTYKADLSSTAAELTTGTTGYLYLQGLDEGIYYLKETTTPAGFNKLDTVIEVKVTSEVADATVSPIKLRAVVQTKNTAGEYVSTNPVSVLNQTGPKLPETGGIGTTIFYIAGGIMVVGAVIFLVAKRRMRVDAE